MTNPERITKIRELLNGIDTQKLFTLAKWFDVQDDNNGVPVEMREVQHDLNKYAIMATEALSLLDGIETEGTIERAIKEGKVVITDADTEQRHIEYLNGKYYTFASFIQVSENIVQFADEDGDGILLYEGVYFSAALAALVGEEPANEA